MGLCHRAMRSCMPVAEETLRLQVATRKDDNMEDFIIMMDDPPTPVEQVYEWLNRKHCAYCELMSTGVRAWWSDPETIEGQGQIRDILKHYDVEVIANA